MLTRSSYCGLLFLAVVGLQVVPAANAAERLVVKYRNGFDPCVECSPRAGAPLGLVGASGELVALHRELGVRTARPLFESARAARRAGVTAAERTRRLRTRFPARARRAATDVLPDLSNVYVIEIGSPEDLHAAARHYAAAPEVEWAHPDHTYSLTFAPNDPFYASSGSWGQSYADLWGMHVTDAATAWDMSSGAGVVIGIVDSGIDAAHSDVAGNLWTNPDEIPGNGIDDDANGFVDDSGGWDFIADDNDPEDALGHGTHVAGTAAAAGDNGVGVVGMAWEARIMPVRVFNTGSAPVSTVAAGIVYAAENGADVINASFSGPPTQIIADAIQNARALGAIVVAAAGNDAADAAGYEPAALPGVITVSASDANDNPASFTNFGEPVSVSAPGVDILSLQAAGTVLGPVVTIGYARASGTSMATPHVAGLAALLLAAQPGLDENEVRWHLELNAYQPGIAGWEGQAWNPYFGYGRIDAGRVFDPPPATARLQPARVERHVHAGGGNALTDLTLSFTTHDPISWTLVGPAWIVPDTPAGVGPATVPLAIDGTGLTGGETFTGAVSADAPGLASSGELRAEVHVHRDDRSGAELPIELNPLPHHPTSPSGVGGLFRVRMASNGSRALVVWNRATSVAGTLKGALVDDQGILAGPFTITASNPRHWFDVASDGQDFFVIWIENADDSYHQPSLRRVAATRVLADGTVTPNWDEDPIKIDERYYRPYHLAYFPRLAFDGADYVVAWQRRDIRTADRRPYRTWVYFRRVTPAGAPWPARKKLALKDSDRKRPISSVELACLPGRCMFTWKQDFSHFFIRLVGERLDYRNRRRWNHTHYFTADDFVAGSDGYMVVGRTSEGCTIGSSSCVRAVRGFRVDDTGAPVDADMIPLTQGLGEPSRSFRRDVAAGFDGTDYLVTFGLPATQAGSSIGTPIFLARLAPNGTVRDVEQEGGLVSAVDTAALTAVATVNGKILVAWRDWRDATTSHPANPAFASVYAQPLAP